MSDDPFAEPGDDESTIIRPIPGGVPPARPLPRLRLPQPRPTPVYPWGPRPGSNSPNCRPSGHRRSWRPRRLCCRWWHGCATPFGSGPSQPAESAIEEMRRFEKALRDQSPPMEQIACRTMRSVPAWTTWCKTPPGEAAARGRTRRWSRPSIRKCVVANGFFDLLEQLRQNLGTFLPVVELMYLCMSLGMQGRYRLSARGPAELDRVREETYVAIMRRDGRSSVSLSIHWRGITAPYRQNAGVSRFGLAALLAIGLLVLIYALLAYSINRGVGPAVRCGPFASPDTDADYCPHYPAQAVPPAPRVPGELDKLAGFLDPK